MAITPNRRAPTREPLAWPFFDDGHRQYANALDALIPGRAVTGIAALAS